MSLWIFSEETSLCVIVNSLQFQKYQWKTKVRKFQLIYSSFCLFCFIFLLLFYCVISWIGGVGSEHNHHLEFIYIIFDISILLSVTDWFGRKAGKGFFGMEAQKSICEEDVSCDKELHKTLSNIRKGRQQKKNCVHVSSCW